MNGSNGRSKRRKIQHRVCALKGPRAIKDLTHLRFYSLSPCMSGSEIGVIKIYSISPTDQQPDLEIWMFLVSTWLWWWSDGWLLLCCTAIQSNFACSCLSEWLFNLSLKNFEMVSLIAMRSSSLRKTQYFFSFTDVKI
jgi:hypothetical protein